MNEGRAMTLSHKSDAPTISVVVALHKPYSVPQSSLYIPLHVGANLNPGILTEYAQDNQGDNISELNPYYSELTGLYWLWKNNNSDYKGLVHYRRYFASPSKKRKMSTKSFFEKIASYDDFKDAFSDTNLVLPIKRNYIIETIYTHYKHTLPVRPLDITREILSQKESFYLDDFDYVMNSTRAHMFNMLVARSDIYDSYCSWLFPILEELIIRINPSKYDKFHARFPGRISELLLDVWVRHHNISYKEFSTISPEKTDWLEKGRKFFLAKFFDVKYNKSF